MKIKGVIFDLDGTLLDTIKDIADSMNEVLDDFGLETHSYESYKQFVGSGAEELLNAATVNSKLTETEKNVMISGFKLKYNQRLKVKTEPFKGILELLKDLSSKGINLAVISNKPDNMVKELVSHYFGNISFTIVIGESESFPRKPSVKSTDFVINSFGLKKDQVLLVGDSEIDIETAKNINIKSVGVSWGYRKKETLIINKADYLIDTPNELIRILN